MNRVLFWLSVGLIVCSAAVFLRRGTEAWTIAGIAPGTALTSGFEEESLLALQRAVHDQPVYADPHNIPFAASYFNWLFYSAYALPLRLFANLAGDAVIPRAARLVTALGCVVGVLVFAALGNRIVTGRRWLVGALSVWLFSGPLVGWWGHTARPDAWALTCETAAVAVLLLFFRAHEWTGIMLAGLLFVAAWSFKQSFGLGLATAVLFLLARRRFTGSALLALVSVTLIACAYVALGPSYRTTMRELATTSTFALAIGWDHLRDAVAKTTPLLLLVLGLLVQRRHGASPPSTPHCAADDAILFGGIGVLVAGPIAFLASCKLGASSNYYVTAQLLLAVLALGLLACHLPARWLAGCLVSAIVMQTLVFTGTLGRIDLRADADELAARWSIWARQPEPRYSADHRLNLPWLNPHSPPFVLAFGYAADRVAQHKFESGGLGGLIDHGYFASLLLPVGEVRTYDGADLRRYRPQTTLAGMTVYVRREIPTSFP